MELHAAQCLVIFQATTCALSAVIYSRPLLSAISTALYQQLLSLTDYQPPLATIIPPAPIIHYQLLLSTIHYYPLSASIILNHYPVSSICYLQSTIGYYLLSAMCSNLSATFHSLLSIVTYNLTATIYYLTAINCHLAISLHLSLIPKLSYTVINSH